MNEINNYFNFTATEVSAGLVLFNLLASFSLMLAVVLIYRRTRHGLSYSQSFVFTLIMMGILGTAVMMVIQNNLIGAFALLGAFTLIRFRTIVKETSDIAYVFFALIIGIAIGLGHYSLAFITTVVLGTIVLLLHHFAFGSVSDNFDYLLVVRSKDSLNIDELYNRLDAHIQRRELIASKSYGDDDNEISLSLKFKNSENAESIVPILKKMGAISRFELLTGKDTSEY